VKGFKDGMKDGSTEKAAEPAAPVQQVASGASPAKDTIDVEAKSKV
jgi:sec-independent protein translocase protein TatA